MFEWFDRLLFFQFYIWFRLVLGSGFLNPLSCIFSNLNSYMTVEFQIICKLTLNWSLNWSLYLYFDQSWFWNIELALEFFRFHSVNMSCLTKCLVVVLMFIWLTNFILVSKPIKKLRMMFLENFQKNIYRTFNGINTANNRWHLGVGIRKGKTKQIAGNILSHIGRGKVDCDGWDQGWCRIWYDSCLPVTDGSSFK